MITSLQESDELRKRIQACYYEEESSRIRYITELMIPKLSQEAKIRIHNIAKQIITEIRGEKNSGVISAFMQEYDLSNDEGVALMCLAESLLRIPDNCTINDLLKDKIVNNDWGKHVGQSTSMFVNTSTWGLILGEYVLRHNPDKSKWFTVLKNLLRKAGEPIIRSALTRAMYILGQHFVTGNDIEEALEYAKSNNALCSYDILGEAVKTKEDAEYYYNSYIHAIKTIGKSSSTNSLIDSHGISIKLSALHPRYQFSKLDLMMEELFPKILKICSLAKEYNITVFIDAEEADRLESSLILFEKLRLDKSISKWEGLGFVVQAYQKRALPTIDFIEDVSLRSQHKIPLRLVKGAYWDYEIKHSQEMGFPGYPVFTRKTYTDASYLVCADKILNSPSSFYPCFATHNAHTVATILEIADKNHPGFEFQRLHGMGEGLYRAVQELAQGVKCRVYSPVGDYKSLLPYLIRRLLENGANSSFVNQINDPNLAIDQLIEDPFDKAKLLEYAPHPDIALPKDMFMMEDRLNSSGIDISDSLLMSKISAEIVSLANKEFNAFPIINGKEENENAFQVYNPAALDQKIGNVSFATSEQALHALNTAYDNVEMWGNKSVNERAKILEEAADALESNRIKFIHMLIIEAGKVISDAISEVREAVDFLRYYAMMARKEFLESKNLPGPVGEDNFLYFENRGVFLCISPWNFPLAIFVGQISAALVTGNPVLAKPSEQTSIIAFEMIKLLHEAGVPKNVLHFLPGDGEKLGNTLLSNSKIAGVVFTGSVDTARIINKVLANRDSFITPLIAETGGMNAMIVDSSALLEQVTTDVITSAFQSAGQRCSALRILFIQEEIAEQQIKMICGAMKELTVGNPIHLSTDVGPIIDAQSLSALVKHTKTMKKDGSLLFKTPLDVENNGHFFPPHMYEISDLSFLKKEIFGPVLHVIRYQKSSLDKIIDSINALGYGLTFAVHSRIYNNINHITKRVKVGNVYVNRNQIGAVVGVQPFGGFGLSGTGPKAGGPYYLHKFVKERVITTNLTAFGGNTTLMSLKEN